MKKVKSIDIPQIKTILKSASKETKKYVSDQMSEAQHSFEESRREWSNKGYLGKKNK